MSCACLTGEPYENIDGSCGCSTAVKPFMPRNRPDGIRLFLQDSWNKKRLANNLTPPLLRDIKVDEPNLSNVKCPKAPAGYAYVWDGAQCNLVVDYNYSPSTAAGTTTNTTTTAAVDSISGFYQANKKAIEIGALLLAGFFAFKHMSGGKGRTRERDVITKTY